MSYKRHQSRKDDNHDHIVDALERFGVEVLDLSAVGGGCSDLLCYRRATGLLRLLEIKNPETTVRMHRKATRKLSKTEQRQVDFARRFPVWRVLTVKQALEAMQIPVPPDYDFGIAA